MNKREQFISDTIKARRAELGLNQDVSDIGGPSRSVITRAERLGELPSKPPARGKLARAFQWKSNACDLLEAGKAPEEAEMFTLGRGDILDSLRAMARNLDLLIRVLDGESSSPA